MAISVIKKKKKSTSGDISDNPFLNKCLDPV